MTRGSAAEENNDPKAQQIRAPGRGEREKPLYVRSGPVSDIGVMEIIRREIG